MHVVLVLGASANANELSFDSMNESKSRYALIPCRNSDSPWQFHEQHHPVLENATARTVSALIWEEAPPKRSQRCVSKYRPTKPARFCRHSESPMACNAWLFKCCSSGSNPFVRKKCRPLDVPVHVKAQTLPPPFTPVLRILPLTY